MLKISNLNQYYGGSHILRDVGFDAPGGKVTALLGRNGVGKTTLLRCLMGLVPAASGAIEFDGVDVTRATSHARVRRHRLRAARSRDLPALERAGEPADGARDEAGGNAGARFDLRDVPGAQ